MGELHVLDPTPEPVKLADGTVVEIQDLKTRQFFKLLRIITRGSMPMFADGDFFNVDGDAEEFTRRLLSVLILSIPDAEDEAIDFLRSLVRPAGLIEGRKLNKADAERNAELTARVDLVLDNPELDDLVTIIETVVRREAADIQALGKRLAGMFKLAQKTGQLKSQPPRSTSPSSVPSPEVLTWSPANTDGPTTSSTGSVSSVSVSVSKPSGNDATTSDGETSNG